MRFSWNLRGVAWLSSDDIVITRAAPHDAFLMTPLDKCAAVCSVLARYDHADGLPIAAEEIAIYERSAGGDPYRRARALEELAFRLAVETGPTEVAVALDRTIAARIRRTGASAA